jgi:integrating conjugative element membrane protein (TIGR03747 family)
MSDPASSAQRQQDRQQGLLMGVVTLPFRFVGVLLGSLMLSIVIECAGMFLLWPEEGWRHSQRMFEFEMGQLTENFTRSILVQEPGKTAKAVIELAYDGALVKTGILRWTQKASEEARAVKNVTARDARYYVSTIYTSVENCLIAAAYTGLIFMVRLLVLTLTIPLFAIAVFVGLVDGLVGRDLRRFEAGRESGYVYHRAKASLTVLLVLPWVTYLMLPISVNLHLILLPCAVLLGLAVDVTARSFKKYI